MWINEKLLKAILAMALTCLFCSFSIGQERKSASDARDAIRVEVSVEGSGKKICDLGKLPVLVKLTNSGKTPLAIDTLQVGRKVYIRANKTEVNASGNGGEATQIDSEFTSPHFGGAPVYKVLKFGESYEAEAVFDLRESGLDNVDVLFISTIYVNSKARKYRGVPVFIGTQRSNELNIDLMGCQAN